LNFWKVWQSSRACPRLTARDLTVRWRDGRIEVDSPVPYEFVLKGKTQEVKPGNTVF
jgi:hypothetical protein